MGWWFREAIYGIIGDRVVLRANTPFRPHPFYAEFHLGFDDDDDDDDDNGDGDGDDDDDDDDVQETRTGP